MMDDEQCLTRLSDFLKIKDASAFLGVPIATLRHWDRTGKLKAIRHPINGYRLYARDELEKILYGLNDKE